MALSESALSDLLDAFRAGEGVDLIRESVRLVFQELIEAEAAEVVGAARYERTDGRVTERNGHRPRLLATQAGDIEWDCRFGVVLLRADRISGGRPPLDQPSPGQSRNPTIAARQSY